MWTAPQSQVWLFLILTHFFHDRKLHPEGKDSILFLVSILAVAGWGPDLVWIFFNLFLNFEDYSQLYLSTESRDRGLPPPPSWPGSRGSMAVNCYPAVTQPSIHSSACPAAAAGRVQTDKAALYSALEAWEGGGRQWRCCGTWGCSGFWVITCYSVCWWLGLWKRACGAGGRCGE